MHLHHGLELVDITDKISFIVDLNKHLTLNRFDFLLFDGILTNLSFIKVCESELQFEQEFL